jgi:hypothetical protein
MDIDGGSGLNEENMLDVFVVERSGGGGGGSGSEEG